MKQASKQASKQKRHTVLQNVISVIILLQIWKKHVKAVGGVALWYIISAGHLKIKGSSPAEGTSVAITIAESVL